MIDSPVATSDTVEWIDKFEAAKRLGLSVTRVLGIAGKGQIRTKPGRNKRGQPINLLHLGDIRTMVSERENPPIVRPYQRVEDTVKSTAVQDNGENPTFVAPKPCKPWITIDEAAEISGLPASTIKGLIELTQLPAIDCGPRPGGRWRIKRSDLEKLEA